MKFTLSWLKEHLETDAPLDVIVATMVRVGLEVEHVDDPAERLKDFTIGEVLAAEPHPDADKLRVCQVATRDGVKQIVCGAPNARAGIKVAYAAVGTYVPGIDVTLSKARIRGVESFGMMCSARELELGDDHDGIIEAPADARVGDSVVEALGASDPVIDFEVTPNRPDTNGVAGVARDLAAAGIGRLRTKAPAPVAGAFPCSQKIALEFPDGAANTCPVFAGRIVRGVKNGQSPAWLKDRLRAIGLRPINALVDITNFMSYDRARPLHVYDADKLKGVIRARLGAAGEKFLALDGREYVVDETMCVIADDSGAIGLGGVMGGEETGCTEKTVNVFIESAYFDPLRTAKTGRKTGINSDARYRFERGVDPAFVTAGLDQATAMVLEACGGEPSEAFVAGEPPIAPKTIDFPPSETSRLTGVEVEDDRASDILHALGFDVDRSRTPRRVIAPTWRPDIEGKADLVEEIVRIVGFDNLKTSTLPRRNEVELGSPTSIQRRRYAVRRALAVRGLHEAVTWSFTEERSAALFSAGADWLREQGLILANPISADLSVMRPSLLPNLIKALQRNADRGRGDLALFEVAPIYLSDRPEGQMALAGGARRSAPPRDWRGALPKADVFTAKADALAALEAAGLNVAQTQVAAGAPGWYHPGRSGVIRLGPRLTLAEFGELHPRILKDLDIDGPIFGFEVNLDAIPAPRARATKTKPSLGASEFLPLTRDFAFIVDQSVEAATLLRAVEGADKKMIAAVRLFDVYQGKGVPEGRKSLAVEVTIQPREKTLTDQEIDAIAAKVVDAAAKATGGALRA
ncbi:MAG: phenylalanine--tRNA ligase subunit beta [Alphaproteobacteria bacterium]|nr:phenylalanine--tRNA ligase subunit beta [Alphaproteobacteria bacterium]